MTAKTNGEVVVIIQSKRFFGFFVWLCCVCSTEMTDEHLNENQPERESRSSFKWGGKKTKIVIDSLIIVSRFFILSFVRPSRFLDF